MKSNKITGEQTLKESTLQTSHPSSGCTTIASVFDEVSTIANDRYTDLEIDDGPSRPKKSWLSKVRHDFSSTYHKRHPIVNALFSTYFLLALVLSGMMFLIGIALFDDTFIHSMPIPVIVSLALSIWFYSFYYIYYMYHFVVGNRRDAFLYAHMGSIVIWTIAGLLYMSLSEPLVPYDDEGNVIDSYLYTDVSKALIYSLLINAAIMGIMYLIMRIKKYGATAWTLLDVSFRKFRTKMDKVCFRLYFVFLGIITILIIYGDSTI